MIKLTLLTLALLSGQASALEPGTYMLSFRLASDVGSSLKISIDNFHAISATAGTFDVEVSSVGWFEKSKSPHQLVRGGYSEGRFSFLIPYGTAALKFSGVDTKVDGKYSGKNEWIGLGKDEAKEGPFKFWMELRHANHSVERPAAR